MIRLTVYRNKGICRGFRAQGHAEYAESGTDIICAAVSVLTTNTANSIEMLTGDAVESEEKNGFLSCRFPNGLSEKGELLMESMLLGLRQIAEIRDDKSGKPFLTLNIEEDKSC
ncbi:MAG: ribosomal-processing cysteine protease Prp [Lachnospiraceae bacterium]|nr:ribosomal-processing cysteine protease Prp [Lachnospiraceae bacterium]